MHWRWSVEIVLALCASIWPSVQTLVCYGAFVLKFHSCPGIYTIWRDVDDYIINCAWETHHLRIRDMHWKSLLICVGLLQNQPSILDSHLLQHFFRRLMVCKAWISPGQSRETDEGWRRWLSRKEAEDIDAVYVLCCRLLVCIDTGAGVAETLNCIGPEKTVEEREAEMEIMKRCSTERGLILLVSRMRVCWS